MQIELPSKILKGIISSKKNKDGKYEKGKFQRIKINNEDKIGECLETAFNLLQSKNLPRNGYYAFVLDKCAPSFRYFGYNYIYNSMKKEVEEIYARS